MVLGSCASYPTATRSSGGGIPGDVHIVAKRTTRILVGSNHRLVVEMVGSILETEEGDSGICLAAIDGTSNRHFGTVDAITSAEMYDDIAIKEIVTRVEGKRWVRSKINTAFCFC